MQIKKHRNCSMMLLENRVPVDCKRENSMNWLGWGFNDSKFDTTQAGDVTFTGNRYAISGGKLGNFAPWFEQHMGIKLTPLSTPDYLPAVLKAVSAPVISQPLIDWMQRMDVRFTTNPLHRLNRSHGQDTVELMNVREMNFGRIADIVVWPADHGQVVQIVSKCQENDVAVIPVGGCTNVTESLQCPPEEARCVIALDTTEMNRILWVDETSMMCRAEAGMIGADLEAQLNKKGLTLGHEPDSIEVSTLGGWVATRASGVKQNKYGNIEELVVHVKLVTPSGVVQQGSLAPRLSAGPDIQQFILGSEGIFGVVTEVTVKVFHYPQCRRYNSIVFPNFDVGFEFVKEVADKRCAPASVRLVDNDQFNFGYAMRLSPSSYFGVIKDVVERLYVSWWRGLDFDNASAVTLLFEGTNEEVDRQMAELYKMGKKYGTTATSLFSGVVCGESHGLYGYRLTYAIAYVRDFVIEYGIFGEAMETSAPWNIAASVRRGFIRKFYEECDKYNITKRIATTRVTQIYDTGCCLYFYFIFLGVNLHEPLVLQHRIEAALRRQIIADGGSISHHHGVGKKRSGYLPSAIGNTGLGVLKSIKQQLDPGNMFAANNLFAVSKQ